MGAGSGSMDRGGQGRHGPCRTAVHRLDARSPPAPAAAATVVHHGCRWVERLRLQPSFGNNSLTLSGTLSPSRHRGERCCPARDRSSRRRLSDLHGGRAEDGDCDGGDQRLSAGSHAYSFTLVAVAGAAGLHIARIARMPARATGLPHHQHARRIRHWLPATSSATSAARSVPAATPTIDHEFLAELGRGRRSSSTR